MEIQKFAKEKNWQRFYSGKWSILSLSYWGDFYFNKWREVFGQGLHNYILISHNGVGTAYFEKDDYENLGKFLAKKAETTDIGKNWAGKLKEKITEIYKVMEGDDINEFIEVFSEYSPWHSGIKLISDNLSGDLKDELMPSLTEARFASESVYVDTEKYLEKIAEKFKDKLEPHLVLSMTNEEFEHFIELNIMPDKEGLEERYKRCALVWINGERMIFTGDEVKEIEDNLFDLEGELKGQIAFKGKVKGKVKIINDPTNAEISEDEILVSKMTRPEYLHLIKKAKGLITDAGGILCHAAIVARELKKPCIVGVEVATKVLKDGQEIELDADNGKIIHS